jgi:ElaB/YqjD/DUF883 family membrane-anchored ribosome-binding protein
MTWHASCIAWVLFVMQGVPMSTRKPSASTGSQSIGSDQDSFESPLDWGTTNPDDTTGTDFATTSGSDFDTTNTSDFDGTSTSDFTSTSIGDTAGTSIDDTFGTSGGNSGDSGSTGSSAADMASTAKDKAQQVTSEVGSKAQQVTGEMGNKVQGTADQGMDKAASGLGQAAEMLRSQGEQRSGAVGSAATRTADTLENASQYLRQANTDQAMTDLESLIRRKPTESLLVAAGLGYLLSRIVK